MHICASEYVFNTEKYDSATISLRSPEYVSNTEKYDLTTLSLQVATSVGRRFTSEARPVVARTVVCTGGAIPNDNNCANGGAYAARVVARNARDGSGQLEPAGSDSSPERVGISRELCLQEWATCALGRFAEGSCKGTGAP